MFYSLFIINMEVMLMSGQVNLVGKIVSGFEKSHSLYGETFYNVTICVKRESGNLDLVPLLISDRLINMSVQYKDVHITGDIRSYNQRDTEKSRLKVYIFVNSIESIDEEENINDILIEGYVCKPPVYRRTPLGREITDLMLASNRAYNKSDYIPCIVWGRNAVYSKNLNTGDRVRVEGRLQSREYTKDNEVKTTYELSVKLLEVC